MNTSALNALILVSCAAVVGACSSASESTSSQAATTALSGQNTSNAPANSNLGKELFTQRTFGGNGRTCTTCHDPDNAYTTSPASATARYNANSNDPLFLLDGSDDGQGNGVTRITRDATILVTIPLPSNWHLAADPSARTVTVARGIPSLINAVAVDPLLINPAIMLDGREPSFEHQALDAINAHFQPKQELLPNDLDLRSVVSYEQTDSDFFSNDAVRSFAQSQSVPSPTVANPALPEGTTDSEKRGREFFIPKAQPASPPWQFRCANCHSGALLNEDDGNVKHFPRLPGARFTNIGVDYFDPHPLNPIRDYIVDNPQTGVSIPVASRDPGHALATNYAFSCVAPGPGSPDVFPPFVSNCLKCSQIAAATGNPDWNRADPNAVCSTQPFEQIGAFMTPSLWNIKNTAPYFHNNYAKTLDDVLAHYVKLFNFVYNTTFHKIDGRLSPQDVADIKAYLLLL